MNPLDEMRAQMGSYFSAEKWESLLFIAVGVGAIAASAWLLRSASPYRGMIYPLVAIALIQIGVGGGVFFRTDGQVKALEEQLARDLPAYVAAELPRMQTVNTNFTIYKSIEIALLAAGIAMTFLFRKSDGLYSAGVGLLIQAAFMLVLDLFAERRAEMYVAQIERLVH